MSASLVVVSANRASPQNVRDKKPHRKMHLGQGMRWEVPESVVFLSLVACRLLRLFHPSPVIMFASVLCRSENYARFSVKVLVPEVPHFSEICFQAWMSEESVILGRAIGIVVMETK
jgi:hypothetical protein